MPRAGKSREWNKFKRQAAFTTLLGKPKYQSIGILVNTQLGLSGDVDDLKKMRCSQNERCGMV